MENWKKFVEWCITHGVELKFGEGKITLSIGDFSVSSEYDNIEIFDFTKFMTNFIDVTIAAYNCKEHLIKQLEDKI